jgi:acyl-CoA dehydrogenase
MTALRDPDEARELEDLTRRLLEKLDRGAPGGRPRSFDGPAWQSLTDAGLTDLASGLEDEEPGNGLYRAATVLRELARHACAVPLAEHDLVGSWVVQQASLDVDPGALRTVVVLDEENTGIAAWGGDADVLLCIAPDGTGGCLVWSAEPSSVDIEERVNIAGEPRHRIRVSSPPEGARALDADLRKQVILRGALASSVLIAGAASRVVELVVDHVSTREQFGRPLSKFQAVQQLVADLAAEAALIQAVSDAALTTVATRGVEDPTAAFAVAAAASCAGHSASTVVRNAHQALGAMGYTHEHSLHTFTNRILAWRSDHGSLRSWDEIVLDASVGQGGGGLWPLLVNEPGARVA